MFKSSEESIIFYKFNYDYYAHDIERIILEQILLRGCFDQIQLY